MVLAIAVVLLGLGVRPGTAQSTETTISTTTTTASSTTATPATTAPSSTEGIPTTAPPTTAPGAGVDPAERQRVEAAEAAKAREVDAANAKLTDLTNALIVLRRAVNAKASDLEYANESLAAAERGVELAEADVEDAQAELGDLETRVSEMAVRAFVGDQGDRAVIFAVDDPTKAMRMDVMRAQATQTDLEIVEDLRAAQEDLVVRRAEALDAASAADQLRVASEEQLAALQQEQDAQASLSGAAEDRLDHLLSERAALASLGADLGSGSADTDALVAQLASNPTATSTGTNVVPPSVVTEDDIAYAGNGIYVHVSIVEDIRQLLIDAAADGVEFAGGGYRSSAAQIATRRSNCGTTNYAIYEMPASQCNPPTARPGRSMHERGMAIDFTYNGLLIRSQSGAGWGWLVANAARYGLQNLPSEPWHWSINGR